MAPISPLYMPHINHKHKVVITEEAYTDLFRIKDLTQQTNNEVAYFMFGEEKENGTIWLDTVVSTFKTTSRTNASFAELNQTLTDYVNLVVSGELGNKNKQIVCHGHTHGTGELSDNFSLGDLSVYIKMRDLHTAFKNKIIETVGMVMPLSGDFNFIFYENNLQTEGFYIFPDVYVRKSDSSAYKLPAYENGNYIKKKTEHTK